MEALPSSINHDVVPMKFTFDKNDFRLSFATIGMLMLISVVVSRFISKKTVLPGVPEFKGVPILGTLPMYLAHGAPELLGKLVATGDDGISFANMMGTFVVSVHSPALTKEVLLCPEEIASREGDPNLLSKSPFSTLRRLIGENFFSYAGPETSHRPNLFIREFNNTKANAQKFDTMQEIATWHIDALAGESLKADINDICHAANDFAISMWGEILYGNPGYYLSGEVLTLAEEIMDRAGSPWSSIWYNIQSFVGLIAPGAPTRSERKIKEGVDRIIGNSIQGLEECELNDAEAPLKLLRNLSVNSGGERTGPLSKPASDFAKLNFFGGHHSIGSIVTWSFIELDRHPECLGKLMNEIDSVDIFNFKHINCRMPYLDAVVMEINRLYPVVHATLRIMHRETTLTSGKQPAVLKPDMLVYLSFLHLQTSKKFWGPNADKFVPERFIGGHNKEHPLLAFGYCPRNCVGYKFAILALKVYLVTFLQKYKFDLKEHDPEMVVSTLIETNKPVSMQVTRRFE